MKRFGLIIAATLAAASLHADTSLTGYGTWWDGDDEGYGGGLRLKKTILGFGAVEGRGGYVNFDDTDTDVYPLDVSVNVRLPFLVSPYAGVGVGYYFIDSPVSALDDGSNYFGQIGVEFTFLLVGAMAEVRYHDAEADYLDGTSVNVGLLLKW